MTLPTRRKQQRRELDYFTGFQIRSTFLPATKQFVPSSFDQLEEKLRGFGELMMLQASPSPVHTDWVPLGLNNLS